MRRCQQEIRGRRGDRARRLAETQEEDLSAIADHVVEREADDAAEGLGVEQDDGGGDPDLERQARVRQDAAEAGSR